MYLRGAACSCLPFLTFLKRAKMSINVNTKKIVRKAEAEYEMLMKFAQRQAIEIAIIEQRSKLLNYQQQMNTAQQKVAQPIEPNPPMPAPFVPAVIPPVVEPDNVN